MEFLLFDVVQTYALSCLLPFGTQVCSASDLRVSEGVFMAYY